MTLDLRPRPVHRDLGMITTFENDEGRLHRREAGDREVAGILDLGTSRDLLRREEGRRRLMIEEDIIAEGTMDRPEEGTEKGIGEGNEIFREQGLTVVTTPTLEDRGDRCHRDEGTKHIPRHRDPT
jgi:hypothetical protein